MSERAMVTYLCTETYDSVADANIRWDDPELAIDWPVSDPSLSPKDAVAPLLKDIPVDRLPTYQG
jgi:dTDP-4-dehydrorhamnose 3,5-epimerase